MKSTVTISHDKKLITSAFSRVMSTDDMENYFETFMNEIAVGAGYREVVDFTAVEKFAIGYDDFHRFASKAADVFSSHRVATTEFIVANDLQLGMARMFSGMAENGDIEFIFTKKESP